MPVLDPEQEREQEVFEPDPTSEQEVEYLETPVVSGYVEQASRPSRPVDGMQRPDPSQTRVSLEEQRLQQQAPENPINPLPNQQGGLYPYNPENRRLRNPSNIQSRPFKFLERFTRRQKSEDREQENPQERLKEQLAAEGKTVAKKIAKQAAKQVLRAAAQAVRAGIASFLASPYGWPIIIAAICLIIFGFILGMLLAPRRHADTPPAKYQTISLDAEALPLTFNPGLIMSDALLSHKEAMSLADIEAFLKVHKSPLASIDPALLGPNTNGRSAAQVIYDATRGQRRGVTISVNPMIILAKLQKEQSLISRSPSNNRYQWHLDRALGYGCPDGRPCASDRLGFTNQVEFASLTISNGLQEIQRKGFRAKAPKWRVGQVYTIKNVPEAGTGHPLWSYNVRMGNAATTLLYTYTPHVYEGNYSMWSIMNSYFRKDIEKITKSERSLSGALPVPGVGQGAKNQCGMASINMIALYYLSDQGKTRLTYEQLPARMKEYLKDRQPQDSPGAWFKTDSGERASACVTPAYINGFASAVPGDWEWMSVNSRDDMQAAIRSLKGGDPVMIYTKPGAWYDNQHIYVLTGYDEKSGEFIVNNPFNTEQDRYAGVQVGVRGSQILGSNRSQTIEHLYRYRGEETYGHTFLIRSRYK